MIPGSTPTHVFTIPFDTVHLKGIRIIYSQNDKILLIKTMEDCTLEDQKILLQLTQEETYLFERGVTAEVQLRLLTSDNTCLTSVVKKFGVAKHLEDEVFTV